MSSNGKPHEPQIGPLIRSPIGWISATTAHFSGVSLISIHQRTETRSAAYVDDGEASFSG